MTFDILTIFPKIFDSYFNEGILGRARKKGLIKINIHNLRDFTDDKHKTTDDVPYGGGPGMVMKIEPIFRALKKIIPKRIGPDGFKKDPKEESRIILLSARGKTFDQKKAQKLSQAKRLILICGRYEGVDQRVGDFLVDEELSIGNFVLSGGELGAMLIVDAISRLTPDVLGNKESLGEESFSAGFNKEYPHYTRPREFNGLKVPEVLLSGDHQKIEAWRKKNRE